MTSNIDVTFGKGGSSVRTVVVGASSGLGRCLGVGLGQRGNHVALLARRLEVEAAIPERGDHGHGETFEHASSRVRSGPTGGSECWLGPLGPACDPTAGSAAPRVVAELPRYAFSAVAARYD